MELPQSPPDLITQLTGTLGNLPEEDIDLFSVVCILSQDDDKVVGEWAPISYIELGNARDTLKIVPASFVLKIGTINNSLGCPVPTPLDPNEYILISLSYLPHWVIVGLIASLDEKRDFYIRTLGLLRSYEEMNITDVGKYHLVLAEIADRLHRSIDEHVRLDKGVKNKAGIEKGGVRVHDENYQPPSYSVEEIDKRLRDNFARSFRAFRYQAYTELPGYNLDKVYAFMDIIIFFIHIFNKLGLPPGRTVKNKAGIPLATDKNPAVNIERSPSSRIYYWNEKSKYISISDCLNLALSSPDMAILIPHMAEFEQRLKTEFSVPFFNIVTGGAIGNIGIRVFPGTLMLGLNYLSHEEVRDVMKGGAKVNWESPYILSYSDYLKLRMVGFNLDDALKLADYYSNGIISKLDLSRTYITGSIIPALLTISYSRSDFSREFLIDLLYPAEYTAPDDYDKYRRLMAGVIFAAEDINAVSVDMVDDGIVLYYDYDNKITITQTPGAEIVLSNDYGDKVILTRAPGADIDMAVDVSDFSEETAAQAEFERTANAHIDLVKSLYPNITVKTVPKASGLTYEITGAPRMIQIYRSNIKQILTHHVSMVRGCLTGNGPERQFYASATCIQSLLTDNNKNYYYFAGKVSPMEIILKYMQRKFIFTFTPEIKSLLTSYERQTPKWNRQALESIYGGNWAQRELDLGAIFGYGNFNVLQIHEQIVAFKFNVYSKYNAVETNMLQHILTPRWYQLYLDQVALRQAPRKVTP